MLDNKDKKILSIISNNARLPTKSLSKKIHLSREVIDYHIKKLEKEKIIIGYQARLNLAAFSILAYNLLIKLKNYNQTQEKQLIKHLKEKGYTHYIAKIGGNYDFIIGFTIKTVEDLKTYIDSLYEEFPELIHSHQIFTYLEEIKDNFAPIFDKNNNLSISSIEKVEHPIKLDNIDKQILKQITTNAKTSSVQLANKLNLTSAAIAYRIKNLEKQNIILGYRTIIDLSKLNQQFYYIFFNIQNPNKQNQKKVTSEMKTNPNILFANQLAGTHSYLSMIVAKNNNDFYNKLKHIQNKINNISNIEIFTVLEFIHHNYIPKKYLD